jgi:hypothetical protein
MKLTKLMTFVQNGIITGATLKEEPGDDEVPPQTEQEATADEEEVINTQASQAVDNLEIEIHEVRTTSQVTEEQLLDNKLTEELEESRSKHTNNSKNQNQNVNI